MSPIKTRSWMRSILWKLIVINGLVIGIAIWLAGVSVKDYACLLVNQYPFVSQQQSAHFNETMQQYLFKASLIAVLIAAFIHYFFVKKLLTPLQKLSEATQQLATGQYPLALPVSSHDEVGQLTADFNYLSAKLKQTEQLRQKMVTDIAHELRTPLTNINGYLEALGAGVMEGNKTLYQSLHEESQRMTRLVDQLHQLNVWESRCLTENRTALVSLKELLDDCLASFSLAFENQGMTARSEMTECRLIVDPDGIKQVISNLLKNALQYDQAGWVKIVGKKEQAFYRIMITNEGVPIPQAEAELLFDRFYRLDPSRSRDSGGAGLGLAIVKEIIDQHQGEVGLLTNGKEHTFWFTLPLN
ncbi:sensor histidine kinase [Ammoniphilus oxalaticus]|uniref:sensor histidine kinase n=1 Tax=Ammoniphilus oxalaticus TaxID=66863 RepID=UPI001FE8AE1E|nr:ATP-binding protein [Ammoniphilus oxalaticus]